MGTMKKHAFKKRKSYQSKKTKTLKNKSSDDEKNVENENDDTYDIEASDDEANEVPPKWYDEFPYIKLPKIECSVDEVESLRQEAEVVLAEETNNFKEYLAECKRSETRWMMTMAKSGTSSDKIAALALMVQESPIHNISAISSLVNMAKVSKKHQFIAVLETLTELFTSDLLRPSKKLRRFSKQPLGHLPQLCENDNQLRRKRLCYWLFEDKLKTLYEQFVNLLNSATHDSVQSNREKAITAMLKLLLENREQEDILISNLINKFGDPVHKVASKVVYGLEKVVHRHSKIKETILDEVERMLFRPHIAKRAQYYGICFLSQYRLSGADRELSKRLITLYFSFFKACVKTGDIDSRLMGALLVGVNRAYPYATRGKKNEPVIPLEHIDTMFKVVHFASFKISLQALALLLQVTNSDRFYNALYKKLLDRELPHTSHQAIWINLLLKAIRKDANDNRKKSFIKRILQICLFFPIPLLCGTLVMLSQVLKYIPDIWDNFEFPDESTVKEEDKPIDFISNFKKFDNDDDDDVDKKYEHIKNEEDALNENEPKDGEPTGAVSSSWFHRDLSAPKEVSIPTEKKYKVPKCYDPSHRNPAFAGGEKATFVELASLSKHFHPTVALFAKKILNREKIHYTGDPLKDFTTLHFLERFSFKNPKRQRTDKGEDKEELFRAVGSQRKHYNPTGMRALPVQSSLYLKQSESAIPVDELFLYKYLKGKNLKNVESTAKRKHDDDDSDVSDAESVGSVEFDEYLDNLMVGKKGAKSLDFAEDIEVTKKSKGKKEEEESDEESDDENEEDLEGNLHDEIGDEMDDEVSDEEVQYSDDEMSDADEGDDNEDDAENRSIEDFDSEDESGEEAMNVTESEEDEDDAKLPLHSALRKRISRDFGNMALPVEKFSEMLEEAGRSKSGGVHDLSNRDNASHKQLKWEASKVKQRWRSKNQKPNNRDFRNKTKQKNNDVTKRKGNKRRPPRKP